MLSKLKIITAIVALSLVLTPVSAFAQTNFQGRTNMLNHLKTRISKMDQADDRLMQLVGKFQDRINAFSNQGKDTTSLQSLLSDMKSKLSDADSQYKTALSLVGNIQTSDANFKDEVKQVRTDVKAGAFDLKAARLDAKQIRKGLKDLKKS